MIDDEAEDCSSLPANCAAIESVYGGYIVTLGNNARHVATDLKNAVAIIEKYIRFVDSTASAQAGDAVSEAVEKHKP